MTAHIRHRHHWFFCVAALAVWLALGWPVLGKMMNGGMMRGGPVPNLWLAPFMLFGAAVLAAMALDLPKRAQWSLLLAQLASVVAMTALVPWAGISEFLIIIAWQVAMTATPPRALAWVGFQTAAVVVALSQAISPDLCWVLGKSIALQLLLVFTATAMRREAEAAQALGRANSELRLAQAVVADRVRDAERLRISRELHDAWGHELTALGLQLEIASHVADPVRAKDHVAQAKGLARALLGKVRDVVASLRDADSLNLKEALETLRHTVPSPAVHVMVSPGVRVTPDQAHALIRCAQEAVTNAVKHARAANLWLDISADEAGIRLTATDDGNAGPACRTPGVGIVGMRERIEGLGGRLAVTRGPAAGFTIEAWLPSSMLHAA